jgi:putative ABC transport system substrate-binding protein
MRRREFIAGLGSAAAWPLAARAQQRERTRRVGMLFNTAESDRVRQAQLGALVQRLKELNWDDARNMRLDIRWAAGNVDAAHKYAADLVAFMPDVIVTDTSPMVAALQQSTSTVPIVFAGVIDLVGAGLVESLPRPGGMPSNTPSAQNGLNCSWSSHQG